LRRKLILLNLVLASLVGAAVWQLHENWLAARERERALAAKKVSPAPVPVPPAAAPVEPLQAATYVEVAQNMLFAKDRNPNVAIEAAPEKPVPPFPEAYGVMDLGAGATAIMTEKPGGPQKSYRSGDKVGEFQISRLTNTEIVLAWEGKEFPKKLEELKPKPGSKAAADPAPPKLVEQPKNFEHHPATPDEKFQQIQESLKPKDGTPGIDTGGVERPCAQGDSSPAGSVVGGYRKVVGQSPFGQTCRWVPVR
jgi:hypothetical protein